MTGEPGIGGFFHPAVIDGCEFNMMCTKKYIAVGQQVGKTIVIILIP